MSTSSTSTIHSIIDAALAYTKLTGTDLSKTPFAIALEQSNSPEADLQLLHEREKAFKKYRNDDRKLIKCFSPAIKVLHAFSDIVSEAVSQVSHTCHPGLELPNVHLCVASRPEMDIRVILDPLTTLKISLHDETGKKEDIVKYIKSVVYSDRNMRRWKESDKQLVVDTLSCKADGM